MNRVIERALERFFDSLGSFVSFVVGLTFCIILAAIPVVGEVLDDLTTYKGSPIDWIHVLKIFWPAVGAALTGYLTHLNLVNKARLEMPPSRPSEKSE